MAKPRTGMVFVESPALRVARTDLINDGILIAAVDGEPNNRGETGLPSLIKGSRAKGCWEEGEPLEHRDDV